VVVATTGVAALLLDGGQTALSALKIPIKATEDSDLKDNMHLLLGLQGARGKENEDFVRSILAIGEGLTQHKDLAGVNIPGVNIVASALSRDWAVRAIDHMVRHLKSHRMESAQGYGSSCCVSCPLNADTRSINTQVLDCLTGQEILSRPIDWPDEEASNCFPDHKLKLKAGIPVVSLRNLNIPEGLCNGTWLLVLHLTKNALEA
ncbi:hypothetical protein MJO29_009246, partial [Puccinia striiformis f. sp. tritici]